MIFSLFELVKRFFQWPALVPFGFRCGLTVHLSVFAACCENIITCIFSETRALAVNSLFASKTAEMEP
ncbi:MAG: hypothetical protein CSA81_05460 [Acidobacteria bacterium]|nr:MAG: hypothetical protein CSA81_05460 [Acidobacteriota bacterium]PIE90964.1 MAG: hypothetical protein CR997_03650 [Acidobacteriota bacterium]